jgi:arylsulfatase
LKHYKQTQHEGGISTPFIAHWPQGIDSAGRFVDEPSHLIDVMATVLELSGGTYPDDGTVQPLQGKSLVPCFEGQPRESHEELYFVFTGCRALRQGDWKLVSFYRHQWELYNIRDDRTEQHDLSAVHPDRVVAMAKRWHEIAEKKDFLEAEQSKPVKEIPSPAVRDSWHKPGIVSQWKRPAMEPAD